MGKSLKIEYDVSDLIREIHTRQEDFIKSQNELNNRVNKVEERQLVIEKSLEKLSDNLNTLVEVSTSHEKKITEAETTFKTLRWAIGAVAGVIISISGFVGYSLDSFLKDKVKKINEETIKIQITQLLEKYNVQINEIPNSK